MRVNGRLKPSATVTGFIIFLNSMTLPKEGHACLARIVKATIHRTLKEHPVQPRKIRYYLEKLDPEFKRKMEEVLIVYQEVSLQNKPDNIKGNSKQSNYYGIH